MNSSLALRQTLCSQTIPHVVLKRSVSRIIGLNPLPTKIRFIFSNGATLTKWAAYPANYHTVPTDDDVFNHRDFTKIPLYMQSATLYDIRKFGVDKDFKTSLQDRLEKRRQSDKDTVRKRKEDKIHKREQAILMEQQRKEEESAQNALAAAERAREELAKRKKKEREEEAVLQKGGGIDALKKLAAEQAKAAAAEKAKGAKKR